MSFFIPKKPYLVALIFWILNWFFDGLDGAIARAHQRQTDLGGYLDTLSDFIIYAAIPISLVVITNYGTILLFDLDDPHFLRQCVFIDVPISNFGGADTGIKHTQRGHNGNYA
ncbi:TPA: CDP-alcohol phosphatidyltransferase family protein [Candidatus Poribacteria bacterium]|nr:CDP-alcohol phosphatidyltransferase family protein [Candidatus Poribacteria bacterium]HIB87850.1 CDP-alcohol phosphatidyltransferase family protein [Candidatus Poribacteria bacterium]HIC00505.1 CDP-alcohol phosphatidyltransferase family protein [Candidatus Poribacteria bacterium]HIC16853.1 CDP-alcohol phosphatidyltransferase family protein [Candidatus Poribacteria bacterium]HIN30683.1 CDP-alcohol phosphatidyltransferase family protein [Candidatus Poribacteria bacterium]